MMFLKRRISLLAIFLMLVILSPIIGLTTAFSENSNSYPPLDDHYQENPLLFDAEIYAKNYGVTVEEAYHRFELQDAAGNLDYLLTTKEADTFAGLWIEHIPEFKIVVLFTSDIRGGEKLLAPYIEDNLVSITEVQSASASLAELRVEHQELLSSMKSIGIVADSGINLYKNQVELYVLDRNIVDTAVKNNKLELSENITVITVDSLAEPAYNIYGGLTINGTTGFSVRHASTGTRGIATAGHLNNVQNYGGYNLPFQAEIYSGSCDVQWHTAPDFTVINQIKWWSDGSTRNITSTIARPNQSVGAYVAKYGITTNYTYGTIESKDYAPSYVPNVTATFILVNDNQGYSPLVRPGDSGGPWFLSNTAYGITSGYWGNKGIYMAQNYVNLLGLNILTSR